MGSKNNDIEDAIDECDFVLIDGINPVEMANKIKKLEEMSEKFGIMQIENKNLKDGIVKMMNAFEELKGKTNKLEERIINELTMTERIDGIHWVKYDWNRYKLNDCSPDLNFCEKELVIKHLPSFWNRNSVRANLPIPNLKAKINKSTIAFYFEVEILTVNECNFIEFGFCDKQFPLQDDLLGYETDFDSIGIKEKERIWINGLETKFGNDFLYFNNGDFVGLGIIYQPNSKMECFATCNGQLLGKAELPSKFSTIHLFPAASLTNNGDSIRANFLKEKWKFKEFGRVLE